VWRMNHWPDRPRCDVRHLFTSGLFHGRKSC
jgi:hypothetical protein